jgi:hypothetical protein
MSTTTVAGGELGELVGQLDEIAEEARREFGGLSEAQLNWKPSAEEWSVGQCFEHLIKANGGFAPVLGRIARGERRRSAWEKWSPLSGFFGRLIERSLSQEGGRKYRAPAKLVPAASEVAADIVERFAAHQRELAEQVRGVAHVDLRRTIITSPISGLVTYSLLDAFRIVVAHERRHFRQARRVTKAPGFPESVSS